MKMLAFNNIVEDFNSKYADDPDSLTNAQKRIKYGKEWCILHDWKFLYGKIEDDVSTFRLFINVHLHTGNRELWMTFIWDH
jgi:hypothetical protein